MKRSIFLLALLPLLISAQTGHIHFQFDGDFDLSDTTSVDVRLYNSNSELIYKEKLYEYTLSIDTLKTGMYEAKIFKNGVLYSTRHNISVDKNRITYINFSMSDDRSEWYGNGDSIPSRPLIDDRYFTFFLRTFQPWLSSANEIVKDSYTLGFANERIHYPAKWYGIGGRVAYYAGLARLKQGNVNVFTDTAKKERYTYGKLTLAITNRFMINRNKRFYLDIIPGYNFPVVFHYVGIMSRNTKSVTRRITTLKDFSIIARVGKGNVSFSAEYCLTDYMKSPYPEQPQLTLGFEFLFEVY